MDHSFINESSIMTVTGCVTAITWCVNAISSVVNKANPKYTGMLLSVLAAVGNLAVAKEPSLLAWFLVPVNACMLFCMAFGLNASLLNVKPQANGVLPDDQNILEDIDDTGFLPRLASMFNVKPW